MYDMFVNVEHVNFSYFVAIGYALPIKYFESSLYQFISVAKNTSHHHHDDHPFKLAHSHFDIININIIIEHFMSFNSHIRLYRVEENVKFFVDIQGN